MPSSSHSHQLALSPLACHDRPHASGLSCYHFGSYHGRRAVRFRGSSSDMAQTQTGSAAQHLGGISGCSACLSHPVASTGFSSAFTAPCTANQQASTQDRHCHGSPRLGEVQFIGLVRGTLTRGGPIKTPSVAGGLVSPNGASYLSRGYGEHHWLVGALRDSHAL